MRVKSIAALAVMTISAAIACSLAGCAAPVSKPSEAEKPAPTMETSDASLGAGLSQTGSSSQGEPDQASLLASSPPSSDAAALFDALSVTEDYRAGFDHGPKGAEFQRYIVLHDTEGEDPAPGVVDYWDGNGSGVAAHFIVDKDGSVWQCVPLDRITHHAGYGDAGHNDLFGIAEDGRDDMVGTAPIGDWAPDYAMNAWSIGIEMVHVGGSGDYPEEQLDALDSLIAYLDAYYGFESEIIDHKAWRSGNSDTSLEFAAYLSNYQDHRSHAPA